MVIWDAGLGRGGLAGKHFLLPSLSINMRPSPPITCATTISQIKK